VVLQAAKQSGEPSVFEIALRRVSILARQTADAPRNHPQETHRCQSLDGRKSTSIVALTTQDISHTARQVIGRTSASLAAFAEYAAGADTVREDGLVEDLAAATLLLLRLRQEVNRELAGRNLSVDVLIMPLSAALASLTLPDDAQRIGLTSSDLSVLLRGDPRIAEVLALGEHGGPS
jgi:hypothetical protein